MPTSVPTRGPRPTPAWLAWLALGLVLLALAWLLPVNVKSLNPALLREAGRHTPTPAAFGRSLLELDKPGPAALVLTAARAVGDPDAQALASRLEAFGRAHPDMVPWGGWDAALEQLLRGRGAAGPAESRPVLSFLVLQSARENLRAYLAVSRLPGVQALLETASVPATRRFVPARRPGGQPLDAIVLLTAYLWQGGHLAPPLQREVRGLADAAVASADLGELEDFYLDILTLGRRLDWVQLAELLRSATSTSTVAQFAHLARVAPEHLPVIYAAALMTKSADGVARYLITHGRAGADNLRLALSFGAGAADQLVQRQAPVTPGAGPEFEFGAAYALRHPELALLAKYGAFLAGIFLLLRSIDLRLFAPLARSAPVFTSDLPRVKSGVLALILTFIFFVFSEPFLLKAAAQSEYQLRIILPALAQASALPPSPSANAPPSMNLSTVLSITVFALLQILMYVACLLKISEIDRQTLPTLLKLRLMENEENLFDGGLYIGIAGTATALVLQVLGVIEANLLAAYSSNLFGIVCVALVKIRHVRPYKRKLILEGQALAPATS
jgi:hypothetical protein